ncbi:MAG: alkaline phosphatase [bacterium]|nr:alkaline phosphatase [bacterium]
MNRVIFVLLALNLINFNCEARSKYVFLLIGDGMGIAQRTLAEFLANSRVSEQSGIVKLNMNKLPVQGYLHTYSTDSYITDSAASATTYAIGKKTYSGSIGLDKDGGKTDLTLMDYARKRKMKTGIITNVPLNHATPAAFYGKVVNRRLYNKIADDLVVAPFDFVGGACIKVSKMPGLKRTPDYYYSKAKENGYTFHSSDITAFKPKANERDWVMPDDCGKGADIPYAIDRKGSDHTTLKDYVSMAIKSLKNPNGFFLMAEGGKIDWACHSNDAATAALEVLDFDEAVKVAVDFYEKHPDETTVVVVADHETGGLSLGLSKTSYTLSPSQLLNQKISMFEFNNVVQKWRETKPSFEKLLSELGKYFSLGELDENTKNRIEKAYDFTFDPKLKDKFPKKFAYGPSEPISILMVDLIAERTGIGWSTVGHTGVPIPVSATGVGQNYFSGMVENTVVFEGLKKIIMTD